MAAGRVLSNVARGPVQGFSTTSSISPHADWTPTLPTSGSPINDNNGPLLTTSTTIKSSVTTDTPSLSTSVAITERPMSSFTVPSQESNPPSSGQVEAVALPTSLSPGSAILTASLSNLPTTIILPNTGAGSTAALSTGMVSTNPSLVAPEAASATSGALRATGSAGAAHTSGQRNSASSDTTVPGATSQSKPKTTTTAATGSARTGENLSDPGAIITCSDPSLTVVSQSGSFRTIVISVAPSQTESHPSDPHVTTFQSTAPDGSVIAAIATIAVSPGSDNAGGGVPSTSATSSQSPGIGPGSSDSSPPVPTVAIVVPAVVFIALVASVLHFYLSRIRRYKNTIAQAQGNQNERRPSSTLTSRNPEDGFPELETVENPQELDDGGENNDDDTVQGCIVTVQRFFRRVFELETVETLQEPVAEKSHPEPDVEGRKRRQSCLAPVQRFVRHIFELETVERPGELETVERPQELDARSQHTQPSRGSVTSCKARVQKLVRRLRGSKTTHEDVEHDDDFLEAERRAVENVEALEHEMDARVQSSEKAKLKANE